MWAARVRRRRPGDAIYALIDALRCNPKNEFALLMMGNILGQYKDDLETALKYYEEVLKIKLYDHYVLNNIRSNLMRYGRIKEIYAYFKRLLLLQRLP